MRVFVGFWGSGPCLCFLWRTKQEQLWSRLPPVDRAVHCGPGSSLALATTQQQEPCLANLLPLAGGV